MSSLGVWAAVALAMVTAGGGAGISSGQFRWSYGPPVLEARAVEGVEFISVKDPSIVRYGDKWHLFCTSLDGNMWRTETSLAEFPKGWSKPVVALTDDIFEASHTYRLKGLNKYLTLVEAQNGHGWRYYKAYLADHLDGAWRPLAADKDKGFASMANVKPAGEKWTDVVSHGELLRSGCDEKLEVDPASLRFLFQGVLEKDRQGKNYGEIPWRLGILEPRSE